MEIKRSGSQPSGKGPAEYFTGMVRVDPLFQAPAPARVLGVNVTFEPCARTNWHTHPLGATCVSRSAPPRRSPSRRMPSSGSRPLLLRCDYLLVESTGISEPLPVAEPRLGRRTVLTFPLLPPPQKN